MGVWCVVFRRFIWSENLNLSSKLYREQIRQKISELKSDQLKNCFQNLMKNLFERFFLFENFFLERVEKNFDRG